MKGFLRNNLNLEHLSFDLFKKIPIDKMTALEAVQFCGSFGDPLMHPNLDKFLDFFSKQKINIFTNASLRNKKWWKTLGTRKNVSVTFCIDGIGVVHEQYRINTSYSKIIKNAKDYIDAGGEARWQFIVFKHNHHQIDSAKKLAKKIGFKEIFFINSDRFETGEKWPVYIEGRYQYDIEPAPDQITLHNKLQATKGNNYWANLFKSRSKEPITCKWAKNNKLYIHGDGTVFPCCMMGAITAGEELVLNIFQRLIKNYNKINLKNQTLEEILNGPEYKTYFTKSLEKMPHPTCIQYCDKYAGVKEHESNRLKY
tara:strand:+ start:80 stop:1015 length:936 start_codon:yes stop_codon:yes gene_type:complete